MGTKRISALPVVTSPPVGGVLPIDETVTSGITWENLRTAMFASLGTMSTQAASAVAITGGTITGLGAPSVASDAANKSYVDGIASGVITGPACDLATAAALPNTPTYANGASGVGATLTAGSNTTLTVDGTAAPLNTVVLVKNQVSTFQNGIYKVTTAGSGAAAWVLTRATYLDQAAEMLKGYYTLITGGATNISKAYTLGATVTTVGTDALTWNQFSSASVTSFNTRVGAVTFTAADLIAAGARSVLAGNQSYYVRADGSDSNTGLVNNAGGAFLTIQKAVDVIYATLDLGGFNVTINVAAGTYTGATVFTGRATGQTKNSVISIVGDTGTPSNVVISTTGADAFTISSGAAVTISGVKVQTTTSGNCFTTQYASFLTLASFEVGACAGYQISTSYGSFTFITSQSYTISGGATAHYYTVLNSEMLSISNTITLTGTPAFSLAFLVGAVSSYSHVVGTTFTGAATGARFYLYMNAVYSDGGANAPTYLPGNAVGTTFGGAIYNNDESYYGWANYTPTVSSSGGTTATATGKYKVHGRDLYLHLIVTCTAAGAGTAAAIPFPTANDQYSLASVSAAVSTQAMACLDRTAISAGIAFVDSGNTSVTLVPAAFAFTTGHVYIISGVIALS